MVQCRLLPIFTTFSEDGYYGTPQSQQVCGFQHMQSCINPRNAVEKLRDTRLHALARQFLRSTSHTCNHA